MKKIIRLLGRVLRDTVYQYACQKLRTESRTVLFYTNQTQISPEMAEFLCGVKKGILCAPDKKHTELPENIRQIAPGGIACRKALAQAGVIAADTPLPKYFIKQRGQVLIAIRSTAPEEPTGRQDFTHAYAMGYPQKNLLGADLLIFPSEDVRMRYFTAYHLDGLYRGRVAISTAPEQVLEHLRTGGLESVGTEYAGNGKENVLIYAGSLAKNGMTSALLALLAKLDLKQRNYYLSFKENALAAEPKRLLGIPAQVGFVPVFDEVRYTFKELFFYVRYFRFHAAGKSTRRVVNGLYRREFARFYGDLPIDKAIQFTGYDASAIKWFEFFPDAVLFIHNDMVREIQSKRELCIDVYRQAYKRYHQLAAVSEDVVIPARKLGAQKDKLTVVPNLVPREEILRKAELPIAFDPDTFCTISQKELETLLASKTKVIVTMGRFSLEKGHIRLMEAFEQFAKTGDFTLLIIGGYGDFFAQTLARAQQSPQKSRIVILRSIQNPMPILKRCDVFVLPSLYEALGLVLLEADILGLPVFATNVRGPRLFLQQHGGRLVEDSTQGILSGLELFAAGGIPKLRVDYEEENKQALAAFERLLQENDR